MAYVVTFPANYLDIDGVPLSTPAWEVTNLEAVASGPDVRGEPRILPGAFGARANLLRPTVTLISLQLYIYGDRDPEGNVQPDGHEGVIANIDRLRSTVTDPVMTGRGTRTATWHRPSPLAELTATVQVRKLEIGDHLSPDTVPATIDLSLIGGTFR